MRKEKKNVKKKKNSGKISFKNLEFFMSVKGLSLDTFGFFDASLQLTSLRTTFKNLKRSIERPFLYTKDVGGIVVNACGLDFTVRCYFWFCVHFTNIRC